MQICSWEEKLRDALLQKNLDRLMKVIGERTTDHAGSLKMADKETLYQEVMERFPLRDQLISFLHQMDQTAAPVLKQLILHCLPHFYVGEHVYALNKLEAYANDENWEVRETAAWSVAELIICDYEKMIPLLHLWASQGTAKMQRAAAVGIKVAAKQRNPQWINDFLSILTPIMESNDAYVKKNLGAFAIGDGLLRYYPAQTLAWLKQLAAQTEHTTVLWNVAMVFTSAASKNHPGEMEAILTQIHEKNSDKQLRSAVLRACKKQLSYHPDRMKHLLQNFDKTK